MNQEVIMHREPRKIRAGALLLVSFLTAALVHAHASGQETNPVKDQLVERIIASGIGQVATDVASAAFHVTLRSGCASPDATQPETDVAARDELVRLYLHELNEDELEDLAGILSDSRMEGVLDLMGALHYLGTLEATGDTQDLMIRMETDEPDEVSRAMADIRVIATATEAFGVDNDLYPDARTIEDLAAFISPIYVRNAPMLDPWGRSYAYMVLDDGKGYRLASAGPDGRFDAFTLNPFLDVEPLATEGDDYDLVYENGSFLRYPAAIVDRVNDAVQP